VSIHKRNIEIKAVANLENTCESVFEAIFLSKVYTLNRNNIELDDKVNIIRRKDFFFELSWNY